MPENLVLVRCAIIVTIVAAFSGTVGYLEHAQGQREYAGSRFDSSTWVRTVDGWESPDALRIVAREEWTPQLHPSLVAGFQLTASLFALLAFPAAKSLSERRKQASTASQKSPLAGLSLLRS